MTARPDHHGNLLAPSSCAICVRCWVYHRMADPAASRLVGKCIYGGPYRGMVEGYAPGEVEAARRKAYGDRQPSEDAA